MQERYINDHYISSNERFMTDRKKQLIAYKKEIVEYFELNDKDHRKILRDSRDANG